MQKIILLTVYRYKICFHIFHIVEVQQTDRLYVRFSGIATLLK